MRAYRPGGEWGSGDGQWRRAREECRVIRTGPSGAVEWRRRAGAARYERLRSQRLATPRSGHQTAAQAAIWPDTNPGNLRRETSRLQGRPDRPGAVRVSTPAQLASPLDRGPDDWISMSRDADRPADNRPCTTQIGIWPISLCRVEAPGSGRARSTASGADQRRRSCAGEWRRRVAPASGPGWPGARPAGPPQRAVNRRAASTNASHSPPNSWGVDSRRSGWH
jgi:hypothetical protein